MKATALHVLGIYYGRQLIRFFSNFRIDASSFRPGKSGKRMYDNYICGRTVQKFLTIHIRLLSTYLFQIPFSIHPWILSQTKCFQSETYLLKDLKFNTKYRIPENIKQNSTQSYWHNQPKTYQLWIEPHILSYHEQAKLSSFQATAHILQGWITAKKTPIVNRPGWILKGTIPAQDVTHHWR